MTERKLRIWRATAIIALCALLTVSVLFAFGEGFWLENGIFSGEQDGKRKINPVSAFHFGSVFSSASADRDQETCKKPWKLNVSGVFHALPTPTKWLRLSRTEGFFRLFLDVFRSLSIIALS